MIKDLYTHNVMIETPEMLNVDGIETKNYIPVGTFKGRLSKSGSQQMVDLTTGKLHRVQPEIFFLYISDETPIGKNDRVYIEGNFYLVNSVEVIFDGRVTHHLRCIIERRQ
ncbi:MAG: hypothetical protein WCO66_02455 [Candidatus Absconditabacteria bacterium]